MSIRGAAFAVIVPVLLAGCAKEPLTKEKAQELIEASADFQPGKTQVRLTEDEVQRGTAAGYWSVNGIRRSDSTFAVAILVLTPVGATYFRGAPTLNSPVMALQQELGARVIEITKIEDDPGNKKQKNVEFTWTRRFENQVPEMVEFFKDQPTQNGKKTFVYGDGGWAVKP
ncbi:MAG TPA: hypothetical protein VJP87_00390 [Candidatus Acidoferrales bacterium]|nr:hypothetical protein [Candidatus Acidoferrales bacterium]